MSVHRLYFLDDDVESGVESGSGISGVVGFCLVAEATIADRVGNPTSLRDKSTAAKGSTARPFLSTKSRVPLPLLFELSLEYLWRKICTIHT